TIRAHDIGVSDGRTSCDFYHSLDTIYGRQLDFVASDFAPFLYVVRWKQSARRLILDDQDNVLQIISPPFVFNVFHPESKAFYPLNHFVRLLVTRSYVRPLLRKYKDCHPSIERTQLDLLCYECRINIASKSNFRFERYDILSSPKELFNVIRAMNVLNLVYFSREKLTKAIANVIASLEQGGLFITGSNLEAGTIVNGGIYKKCDSRLEKIEVSGSGSQIDELIREATDVQTAQNTSCDLPA